MKIENGFLRIACTRVTRIVWRRFHRSLHYSYRRMSPRIRTHNGEVSGLCQLRSRPPQKTSRRGQYDQARLVGIGLLPYPYRRVTLKQHRKWPQNLRLAGIEFACNTSNDPIAVVRCHDAFQVEIIASTIAPFSRLKIMLGSPSKTRLAPSLIGKRHASISTGFFRYFPSSSLYPLLSVSILVGFWI